MFPNKLRIIAIILSVAVIASVVAGCGGAFGQALRIVGITALLPREWTEKYEVVRLVVDIVSGQALMDVIAKITRKGSTQITEVVLTKTAEGKYQGEFEAAAGDTTVTYTAVVVATDVTGNSATSETVAVEIPPLDSTPAE